MSEYDVLDKGVTALQGEKLVIGNILDQPPGNSVDLAAINAWLRAHETMRCLKAEQTLTAAP
jgi:hypothetical protein